MTTLGLVGIVLAVVLSVAIRRAARSDEVLSPHGLEALGRVNQSVVDDARSARR